MVVLETVKKREKGVFREIPIPACLGHSSLETTEIYLNVMGVEEREMVKRLWEA